MLRLSGVLNKTLVVGLRTLLVKRAAQDIEVARDQAELGALVALGVGVGVHAGVGVDVEERSIEQPSASIHTNPPSSCHPKQHPAASAGASIAQFAQKKQKKQTQQRKTHPLGTFIKNSFCAPCTKLATRNQLVFFSSPLPKLDPIT